MLIQLQGVQKRYLPGRDAAVNALLDIDLTVQPGERMAVLTDEAGIFLVMSGIYSGGSASIDVFLQAHAGSPVRVDRAEREAYLERPALSFGLALQPGILADVASGRRFRGRARR